MSGHRVVGAFSDPRAADEAERRLAERSHRSVITGKPGSRVEQNAREDTSVAYEAMGDRGDSSERPPDITVAVHVEDLETAHEVEQVLRDADAEEVVVETRPD